jgi:hypothetical protein
MYRAHFKYHPVGQGCFYTGELFGDKSRLFNFVYDCGTVSEQGYVNDAVDQYPVKREDDKINVCIISHFHRDHVSGIPRLLKGKECDRVVIPYYDPLERLIVYLQSADTEDVEYRRMMQDPVSYFSGDGFNVGRIIVVGGPDNTERQIVPTVAPPPSDNEKGRQETDAIKEEVTYENEWQEPDENVLLYQELKSSSPDADFNKVDVVRVPYQLRTPLYKFVFYCRKMEGGSDVDYINKIRELRLQVDGYLTAKKSEPGHAGMTFKDLFDGIHIKEIGRIYGRVFGPGKLNGTSLAAYHQSILRPGGQFLYHHYDIRFGYPTILTQGLGSLMTGDLDLETNEKLTLFQDYYRHYLPTVGVFQVMHHGSDKNWPFGIPHSRLHEFRAYVINHGAGRAHHPGGEVSKLLRKENPKHVYLNNEFTPLQYGHYYGIL